MVGVGNFQKNVPAQAGKLLKNNCAEGPWVNIKQELSTIHAGHVFNDKKNSCTEQNTQPEGEKKNMSQIRIRA